MLELLVVSLIIAFRLIPVTDTPVILLIGWLSLRLRYLKWRDVGIRKPTNIPYTVIGGVLLGVSYWFFEVYVIEPFIESQTGTPVDLSQFEAVQGNLIYYLILLALAWTLAAFAEEMVYRGYLLNRFADLLGEQPWRWGVAVVLVALLFGAAHTYQGISGMIVVFIYAVVVGSLYLLSGRNMWLPIIFHGASDTIGITFLYLGLYPGL
ncbi:MAG: CPBP family intramembrane metalloprotease [candidate division Zixibacteria bacterium]|nr:CPBP family intramembrane metalloprotease [candidate division Zixibacteria bacterium]